MRIGHLPCREAAQLHLGLEVRNGKHMPLLCFAAGPSVLPGARLGGMAAEQRMARRERIVMKPALSCTGARLPPHNTETALTGLSTGADTSFIIITRKKV